MNTIGNVLNVYTKKYSSQTIANGVLFYEATKKVNQDYKKKQEKLAEDKNVFLNFVKKVNQDYKKKQEAVAEGTIVFLNFIRNIQLKQMHSNTLSLIQTKQHIFKLNKVLNGSQIQYLDNKAKKNLNEFNEKPFIIVTPNEKKHIVSDNDIKALIIIAFCKKFNIKSNNVKELENKIIDLNKNGDGKKINCSTAKAYFRLVYNLINKYTDKKNYSKKDFLSSFGKNKLNKIKFLVLNELKSLYKLQN